MPPEASVVHAERARIDLLDDLVTANRILFHQGVVDAFGHVSARDPSDASRFLMARNMAPGSVQRADIVDFDLAGEPLNAEGRRVYLERFIHSGIYRARPDVHAVVHSHSPAVLPMTLARRARLRAVCHMAGFIGGKAAPVFEIREAGGDATDLLVRDSHLGQALARCLGARNIVLMRGHGSTVVGPSLQAAVFRAVYAEVNARAQTTAQLFGGQVRALTQAEAEACVASHEGQASRAWDLWKAAARQDA
jgi:HCOMODA/2-hydroxy-3-carboxy-muconic semialdehyde decarboxylase